MSTPVERSSTGVNDGDAAEATGWFDSEVPTIVSGLDASDRIDTQTVEAAWGLIAQGRSRAALELVMAAVDAS